MNTNIEWFVCGERRKEAEIRLFCLPFAGGGASAYHGWSKAFPESVEVLGVQLPGRESRLRDKPFEDVHALTAAIVDALLPELNRPFSLFGYSMGSILAFEVARELRKRGAPEPEQLFAASRIAPQLPNPHPPLAHLPDQEFLDSIRDYFSPPEKAWGHPELLELLMPALRADFKVCDTYIYRAAAPLACSIHAYAGRDDRGAPVSSMKQWGTQTAGAFTLDMMPGGHFFMLSQLRRLQRSVLERLTSDREQRGAE